MRAKERVDQQEADGKQGKQDPYPRGAAPYSSAETSTPTNSISISSVGRFTGIGSDVALVFGPRGLTTGYGDALTSLLLGKFVDLFAVFPRVLARIVPLRLQVSGRGAEYLGEVGANPFLTVLFPATAPIDVVAVSLGLVDVTVSHVPHSATTRPKAVCTKLSPDPSTRCHAIRPNEISEVAQMTGWVGQSHRSFRFICSPTNGSKLLGWHESA